MRRVFRAAAVLTAAAALVVSGVQVSSAVGDGEVYSACLKSNGMLYGVTTGTPSCRAEDRLISWNREGVPGRDGRDGEDGQDGQPGPAGIASAQSCPAGQYVSGIGSDGTLTCTALPGSPAQGDPGSGSSDADGDGYTSAQGDCDDTDPRRHPDAQDVPDNGVDENCDGSDLEAPRNVQSLDASPDSARTSSTVLWTVHLDRPAPSGGLILEVHSAAPTVASPRESWVQVPQGQQSAGVLIDAWSDGTATITVSLGSQQLSAPLRVVWAGQPSVVESVTVEQASLPEGGSTMATVTLDVVAPAGGTSVTLSSSDPAVAGVPGSVMVAGGRTSVTFTVQAGQAGSATVTAEAGGVSRSVMVTVTAA